MTGLLAIKTLYFLWKNTVVLKKIQTSLLVLIFSMIHTNNLEIIKVTAGTHFTHLASARNRARLKIKFKFERGQIRIYEVFDMEAHDWLMRKQKNIVSCALATRVSKQTSEHT